MRRNALWVIALALSCRGSPGHSPESAADWFVDKLYVEMAPAEALAVSSGAAEDALREMVRLRAEAGGPPATRPRVSWQRAGAAVRVGDAEVLRYHVRSETGGAPLRKEVAVEVRRGEGGWRVVRHTERDEVGP